MRSIKFISYFLLWACFVGHFLYTIGLSLYDVFHLKRIKWEDVELVSHGGEDSSPTCDFINEEENIKVSREYDAFYGLLTRLWGIDIEYDKEAYYDIIFYLKEKDYKKIRRGQLSYEDFVLFRENKEYPNNINYQEYIPFFGVRKVGDSSPFMLTLFLDIWLDNHSIGVISFFLIFGLILFAIFSKIDKDDNKDYPKWIENNIGILFLGCAFAAIACLVDLFIL